VEQEEMIEIMIEEIKKSQEIENYLEIEMMEDKQVLLIKEDK